MRDIKLIEAVLRWNNNGGVVVTKNIPCEYSKSHHRTLWACESCWQKMTETERVKIMMLDLWGIVIRDGVDPKDAHKAMLIVPEFRQSIAIDVDGAE